MIMMRWPSPSLRTLNIRRHLEQAGLKMKEIAQRMSKNDYGDDRKVACKCCKRLPLFLLVGISIFVMIQQIRLKSSLNMPSWTSNKGIVLASRAINEAPPLLESHNKEDPARIRIWGCHRNETPLIFVHIGKAGGGMIRARFAAGALNYTRGYKEWWDPELDQHYYPIPNNSNNNSQKKAYFCNSRFKNHRLPNSTKFPTTFEGNMACFATTPIGMALACPQTTILGEQPPRCKGCDLDSDHCNIVYVSHNMLGNELHFLPPKYLQKWWSETFETSRNLASLELGQAFSRLLPNVGTLWCPRHNLSRSKVIRINHVNSKYTRCSEALSPAMDSLFHRYWRQEHPAVNHSSLSLDDGVHTIPDNNNYAPIYGSMPLHRATLLREPFSWLHSKFFWHKKYRKYKCDDIEAAVHKETGWARDFCMEYVLYLCGDDCAHRYDHHGGYADSDNNEHASKFLEQVERQAETNLRQSFSVVGLLNETGVFLDMVTSRIAYINMSLNPSVTGMRHASIRSDESKRCSNVYQDASFQQDFKLRLPCLASLERLYQVGVKVNQFQRQELEDCSGGSS
jgi:hypothetical protein